MRAACHLDVRRVTKRAGSQPSSPDVPLRGKKKKSPSVSDLEGGGVLAF